MLGWLVEDQGMEPCIPVFDERERKGGAFSAADFTCGRERPPNTCPFGKAPKPCWRHVAEGRPEYGKDGFKRCFACKQDCTSCPLKPCCTPNQPTRKTSRSRYEVFARLTFPQDQGRAELESSG